MYFQRVDTKPQNTLTSVVIQFYINNKHYYIYLLRTV